MNKRYLGIIALAGLLHWGLAAAPSAESRGFTFLSTSDCHFAAIKNEDRNDRNLDTIRAMNAVTDLTWPEELGGGRVQAPRGVMALGDIIDDGDMKAGDVVVSERQYAKFLEYFGLDGKDGLLNYPVFETWGNHDGPPEGKEKNGFSSQGQIKKRNLSRKEKGLINTISDNGLHYSLDWDGVHFVMLGIYPADKQRDGIRYSPVWHDPQMALSFLKADLARNVGDSGRPVVLMSHTGFDSDWWVKEDWADLYQAVNQYNIALYIYGHSGTGVKEWAPAGETRKWLCLNDGQTENGFFIIEFKDNVLRFGNRVKDWSAANKAANAPVKRVWNGQWKWQWTTRVDLSRQVTGSGKPASKAMKAASPPRIGLPG